MNLDDVLRMTRDLVSTSRVPLEDLIAALTDGNQSDSVDTPTVTGHVAAPTIAEHIDTVLGGLSKNTGRTYRTHFLRLRDGVGPVCACECEACCSSTVAKTTVRGETIRTTVHTSCHCDCSTCRSDRLEVSAHGHLPVADGTVKQSTVELYARIAERLARKTALHNNRLRISRGLTPERVDGRVAQETAVLAMRRLMKSAVGDHLLRLNPAAEVKPKKRQETRKRSMNDAETADFFDVVVSGGNDPELDFLIAWFHLETGARQQGALGLRIGKVDLVGEKVELFEKGGYYRDQPASAELCEALLAHAVERGGPRCTPGDDAWDPEASVFHYRPKADGTPRPLTAKRYETLFRRVQLALPFANEVSLTAHQLRKTGAVAIERIAGTQVARRWLGHQDRSPVDGYTKASWSEVVEAHRRWLGDQPGNSDE